MARTCISVGKLILIFDKLRFSETHRISARHLKFDCMKCLYYLFPLLFVFLFANRKFSNDAPSAGISNGVVSASLYLPDAKNGYYRGTRFDWSGQISALHYNGHSFFGQWFDRYDPLSHDAIMGPVEAFDPVGYEETPTGGSFLKIGVGMLKKMEDKPYFFTGQFPVVNGGTWQVHKRSDAVEFIHRLQDSLYGYEYTKTVRLLPGEPKLLLIHSLRNTGKNQISTRVMNHNFFVIDNEPTGPDFTIDFAFDLQVQPPDEPVLAQAKGRRIFFVADTSTNKRLYLGDITGFRAHASDYNITIKNNKTGAGVNITCDQPMSRLYFWAAEKTICPEPYIPVNIRKDETFRWTITYDFSAGDDSKKLSGMNNVWTSRYSSLNPLAPLQ